MNVMRLATAAPARHDGGRASCWLAGKCRKANASRYDKGLAAPVEVALKAVPEVETVVPMLEVGTETKPRYAIMAPAN